MAPWRTSASDAASSVATGSLNDYLWWMLAGTGMLLWTVVR